MELETAIRTRRTHKVYAPEPVDRATLIELFELARWAPNHHLTNPWRFRVLGEGARAALAREAELDTPGSAAKLDRAPTLIVASAAVSGDAMHQREDLLASAVAAYIVLLGAHARGLAGYWRTVPVLESAPVRAALGIGDEEVLGLLHLGAPRQSPPVPDRAPVEDFARFLD
jgi:nitroreductase